MLWCGPCGAGVPGGVFGGGVPRCWGHGSGEGSGQAEGTEKQQSPLPSTRSICRQERRQGVQAGEEAAASWELL